jgi:hypothetical protein
MAIHQLPVPFGKYSGQPLEVLAEDHSYVEWLNLQPWFVERYRHLHEALKALIASEDTPEHNGLQAKFLDDEFVRRFLRATLDRFDECDQIEPLKVKVSFEVFGFDAWIDVRSQSEHYYLFDIVAVEVKPTLGDDYPSVLRQIKSCIKRRITFNNRIVNTWTEKAVLIIGEFNSLAITYEQLVKFFASDDIKVIRFEDVA